MYSFILLADTSGSMHGEKAAALEFALAGLIRGIRDVAFSVVPHVTVVAFGGRAAALSSGLASQTEIPALLPGGETRLTEAVALARKLALPEAFCVLLSDGWAMDGGFLPLREDLRAYAIGIGFDADLRQLARFAGGADRVFGPEEAEFLAGFVMQREFGEY